jgi:hypothetical protein
MRTRQHPVTKIYKRSCACIVIRMDAFVCICLTLCSFLYYFSISFFLIPFWLSFYYLPSFSVHSFQLSSVLHFPLSVFFLCFTFCFPPLYYPSSHTHTNIFGSEYQFSCRSTQSASTGRRCCVMPVHKVVLSSCIEAVNQFAKPISLCSICGRIDGNILRL